MFVWKLARHIVPCLLGFSNIYICMCTFYVMPRSSHRLFLHVPRAVCLEAGEDVKLERINYVTKFSSFSSHFSNRRGTITVKARPFASAAAGLFVVCLNIGDGGAGGCRVIRRAGRYLRPWQDFKVWIIPFYPHTIPVPTPVPTPRSYPSLSATFLP